MFIKMNDKIKEKPNMKGIDWGTVFTEYMISMDYENGKWGELSIIPYGPLENIEPSNTTLHYAQSVFEGQKCYKRKDNGLNIFRPMDNLNRLNKSCERMCIPTFSEKKQKEILLGLKTLLQMDAKWVPEEPNSLYIRAFVFGTENFVGLRSSNTFKFMVILSPTEPYLGGFQDIKMMIPDKHIRAVKGGQGVAKASGNYAQCLYPVMEAKKRGYDQCLFLNSDGYITEASAANVFFVINGEIITPKLTGEILHGITRDSIITLAREEGFIVREDIITISDLEYYYNNNMFEEAFLCGTAATIIPISEFYYKEDTIRPVEKIGEFTEMMYKKLTDLQYGRVEDTRKWVTKVS